MGDGEPTHDDTTRSLGEAKKTIRLVALYAPWEYPARPRWLSRHKLLMTSCRRGRCHPHPLSTQYVRVRFRKYV